MLRIIATTTRASALALGLAVGLPSLAVPQAPGALVTDRPDQTESTAIVPGGFVQLELGSLLEAADTDIDETETLTIAPALVRIGVAPRIEARIGFAGWVRTSVTRMDRRPPRAASAAWIWASRSRWPRAAG